MTTQSATFEGMERFYRRVDKIQEKSLQSVKTKAYGYVDSDYSDAKANRIARKLINESCEGFKDEVYEEYVNTPYAGIMDSCIYNRAAKKFSTSLKEEIKNILLDEPIPLILQPKA